MPRNTTLPIILNFDIFLFVIKVRVPSHIFLAYLCRITNAVKDSGGLKERLFNAAYNAKRQAIINGKKLVKVFFSVLASINYKA